VRRGSAAMCGRYRLTRSDIRYLKDYYGVEDIDDLPSDSWTSYNITPQTLQPIVRLNRATSKREFALLRWGLVPYWSKSAKTSFSTINAKAETVMQSPIFRRAFEHRRCLVVADGFFEWKPIDKKNKQAYAVAMKSGEPLAFAGLWERWRDPATKVPLETYSIIVTDANSLLEEIHDRMPVILRRQDYGRWLAHADPAQLPVDLLRPYDPDEMLTWKIGSEIGNPANNYKELLTPISDDDKRERSKP
jgi:putative SOS response-associated peptidase YedK